MRPIPIELRNQLNHDKFYKKCSRCDKTCKGRITFEHVFIYAGRQINEPWAIIPLCAYHHSVDLFQDNGVLDKEINQWIALNRGTTQDFNKYPRFNFQRLKEYLNNKYGTSNNGETHSKVDS